MWPFNMKDNKEGCECSEFCFCTLDRAVQCEDCTYYHMIDSGYGSCSSLPSATIVPWCRIPCSIFKKASVKKATTRRLETAGNQARQMSKRVLEKCNQ